jgi:hypothetical protein
MGEAIGRCPLGDDTDLENEEHVLKSTKEHNHSPEATRADVIKTLDIIKKAASNTRDQPVQIIQDAAVNMNQIHTFICQINKL